MTNRSYKNRHRRMRAALDSYKRYHEIVKDIRKLTNAGQTESTTDAVKRVMSTDRHSWFSTMPQSEGVFELKCMENNWTAEDVVVTRKDGVLWGLLDGDNKPLSFWHLGLSRLAWRAKQCAT